MSDSAFIHKELFGLICNSKLGQGSSREVWINHRCPDYVIKIEGQGQSFNNVKEWELWKEVEFTKAAKWFAPCLDISACGSVLVMKRTIPAPSYPTHLPYFLTDTKKDNYGMLDGKFVCHDYGLNLLMTYGLSARMRRVEEWR